MILNKKYVLYCNQGSGWYEVDTFDTYRDAYDYKKECRVNDKYCGWDSREYVIVKYIRKREKL